MSTRHRVSEDQNRFTPTENTDTPLSSLLQRRVHTTLATSPLPLRGGLSGIGPTEAKLTHDEPTSVRSLIDSDGDTTLRLPSRASHLPGLVFIIYNPKFGT
jgi:hypothetical protein